MKSALICLLIAVLSIVNCPGQDIYLSTLLQQNIYKLNVDDCRVSLLVSHQIEDLIGDITFHPNGRLYGVGLDNGGGLFEIDTISGVGTKVADFDIGFNAMTTDSEGTFYLAGSTFLYTYTLGGSLAFVGDLNRSSAGDLTFFDGELFLATVFSGLVQIDIDNPGEDTPIVTEGVSRDIFGLVNYSESCDGTKVYGVSGGSPTVITFLDLAEGVGTDICSIDIPGGVSGGASKSEFFAASPISVLEESLVIPDCLSADGSITVAASGGVGQLRYSLDLIAFQQTGFFEDLERGTYTVYIQDEIGCTKSVPVTLTNELGFSIVSSTIDTECNMPTGTIALAPQAADWDIFLDDMLYTDELPIQELAAGEYTVAVIAPDGCPSDTTVVISTNICPVFVANIFSPNDDGVNDALTVSTSEFFAGLLTLSVYDRYGNKVYSGSTSDGTIEWDGRFGGRLVETGVYVYQLTVSQADGQSETTVGDVTVLR